MRPLILILLFSSSFAIGQKELLSLSEKHPDSARTIAFDQVEKTEDPKTLSALYHVVATSYFFEDQVDLAIQYLNLEDSLFSIYSPKVENQVSNKQLWANSIYNKGLLVQADSLIQEALALVKVVDDYQLKSSVLLDAGWYARERGKHAYALELYFQAKTLSELNNDESLLAECFSKIAVVYHVKYEFDKAKENYDNALALHLKLNEQNKIARLYNNYGLLYQYQGYSSKAVEYFERSIEMCDSLSNPKGVAIANENLGILCYEDLKNYPLALQRFKYSLDYWKSTNDIYGQSQTMVYLLYVYDLQKNYIALVDSGLKALDLSIKAGAKDVENDALFLLSKGYEGLGFDNKAFHYYKKHIALRDSLDGLNKVEEIKLLGIQNELQSKQIQDSLSLALLHEQESAEIEIRVKEQRFLDGLIIMHSNCSCSNFIFVIQRKQTT